MKLSSLATVLLMAISPAAFADVQLGTVGSSAKSLSGNGITWFDFSLASPSSFNGQLSGNNLWAVSVLNSQLNLVAQTYFSSATTDSFSYSLAAGSYEMLIYLNPGQGAFSGSVSALAAPVPEASNYAMLALGVSAVALFGMRRRQSPTAPARA